MCNMAKRCDFRLTSFQSKTWLTEKKRYKETTYTRPVCVHCNKLLNQAIKGGIAI